MSRNILVNKKGQLAPGTVVPIIIAMVVLVAVILFFTGKFQGAGQQISDVSPQDIEVAITSCKFACDTANAAVNSEEDCSNWQEQYCTRTVIVNAEEVFCKDGVGKDSQTDYFNYNCKGRFPSCACGASLPSSSSDSGSSNSPGPR